MSFYRNIMLQNVSCDVGLMCANMFRVKALKGDLWSSVTKAVFSSNNFAVNGYVGIIFPV